MRSQEALRDLVQRQHGLVGRKQLAELGFDRSAVARAVASGRLERLSPRVLRLGGSADTPSQRAMAATLDVPGSAVSMYSAAGMYRLPSFSLEPVHVVASRRPHRDRAHLGRMHSSVRISEEEISRLDGIPVTNPLRTLHDLAARIHPDRLGLVCDRMLSRRLLRLESLHASVEEMTRGDRRGTKAMRMLALARPAGYRPAESNLERRFERIIEQAGEAPLERQVDLGDDDGWIGRVDFADRRAGVVVEVQSSMFHAGLVDRARDAVRLERLRRAGWIVVEVTEDEIWNRPAVVVARVRSARRRPPLRAPAA
jgi:very-short-patch-repair endonuclease